MPWYGEVVQGPDPHGRRRLAGARRRRGSAIEVDEKAAAAHPFEQEVLHATNAVLPDGTVVDW